MLLPSIGRVQLNAEGSAQLDSNSQQIYTCSQSDITAFAAVLTGWNFDLPNQSGTAQAADPAFATGPMVNVPNNFSVDDKSVRGDLRGDQPHPA